MLPSRVINHETPVERLLHTKPDYTSLRVFGCACWPNLRPYNTHKLAFRSQQCVFLGYSIHHKGYKCLHVPTARIYISGDVVFDEKNFPFGQPQTAPIPPRVAPRVAEHAILLFPHDHMNYCTSVSDANLDAGPRVPQMTPGADAPGSHADSGADLRADSLSDPVPAANSSAPSPSTCDSDAPPLH